MLALGAVVSGIAFAPGLLIAVLAFLAPGAALLYKGMSDAAGRREPLPPSMTAEQRLLSAIRDNAGSTTSAEAAMETTLTVKDADRMLSELASGGHLKIESEDGTLVYSLP